MLSATLLLILRLVQERLLLRIGEAGSGRVDVSQLVLALHGLNDLSLRQSGALLGLLQPHQASAKSSKQTEDVSLDV